MQTSDDDKQAHRNNEMYLVRANRAIQEHSIETETIEYQVIADADTVGEFEYGSFDFTVWEITSRKGEGEDRWLCLRVREESPDTQQPAKASQQGYYHGGGIASEVIALASLFLRRRFILGPMVRWHDLPRLIGRESAPWIDLNVVEGTTHLSDLQRWMPLVENLRPESHERFILAAKLYQQALEMIESKPDLAYVNLVSAVEVLSSGFPIKSSLMDVDAKLARLVEQIPDEALRKQINDQIMKKSKVWQRFLQFILHYLNDSFWDDERSSTGQVDKNQIQELLRRIYDQRSGMLHEGRPFPPYIFRAPFNGEEIPNALGITSRGRTWLPHEYIPYPYFFERMVNHVLKNYLVENQVERNTSRVEDNKTDKGQEG